MLREYQQFLQTGWWRSRHRPWEWKVQNLNDRQCFLKPKDRGVPVFSSIFQYFQKPENRGVPVQEVGGQVDHHWQLRQFFEQLPARDVVHEKTNNDWLKRVILQKLKKPMHEITSRQSRNDNWCRKQSLEASGTWDYNNISYIFYHIIEIISFLTDFYLLISGTNALIPPSVT